MIPLPSFQSCVTVVHQFDEGISEMVWALCSPPSRFPKKRGTRSQTCPRKSHANIIDSRTNLGLNVGLGVSCRVAFYFSPECGSDLQAKLQRCSTSIFVAL